MEMVWGADGQDGAREVEGGGGKGNGRCKRDEEEEYIPSSFPSTRFTAPEHPPHDMLTLNL